jgi:Arc/MetJ-type ribon-helix-helix transcriptional regulator
MTGLSASIPESSIQMLDLQPLDYREDCHMPKKVLIALPPAMLEQVDFIAQCEHRTRSDLIREALRRYLDNFRRTQGQSFSVSTVESSESLATAMPS